MFERRFPLHKRNGAKAGEMACILNTASMLNNWQFECKAFFRKNATDCIFYLKPVAFSYIPS